MTSEKRAPGLFYAAARVFDLSLGDMLWSRRTVFMGLLVGLPVVLAAIVRLLHELGAEGYAEALAEHRRVIREACASEGGVEVDTQGDAFFFAFPTAPGALAPKRSMPTTAPSSPTYLRQ